MTATIRRRLRALEGAAGHSGRCAVLTVADGESTADALARARWSGGYLVTRPILPADAWCRLARAQQAALVAGC